MTTNTNLCPCGSEKTQEDCCLKSCCSLCLNSPSYNGLRYEQKFVLEKSLIRQGGKAHLFSCSKLDNFKPKIVIISGNGSSGYGTNKASNVWDLINQFIKEFRIENKLTHLPGENFLQYISNLEKITNHYEKEIAGSMQQHLKMPKKFRSELSIFLKQNKIELRDLECFECSFNCKTKINTDLLQKTGIITLNWDLTAAELPNTIHLHGNINDPDTLIFPNQEFLQNIAHGSGMRRSRAVYEWIANCETIILWGIALNDYDSIILLLLSELPVQDKAKLNVFIASGKTPREDLIKKLKDYLPKAEISTCLKNLELIINE